MSLDRLGRLWLISFYLTGFSNVMIWTDVENVVVFNRWERFTAGREVSESPTFNKSKIHNRRATGWRRWILPVKLTPQVDCIEHLGSHLHPERRELASIPRCLRQSEDNMQKHCGRRKLDNWTFPLNEPILVRPFDWDYCEIQSVEVKQQTLIIMREWYRVQPNNFARKCLANPRMW